MHPLANELEQTLGKLESRSALALERWVRDAIALAQPAITTGTVDSIGNRWPIGYFQKTAGSFANEPFDLPGE